MAGLVADYSSSSSSSSSSDHEDKDDDEELAEKLSYRVTKEKPVNFFECPPDNGASEKESVKPKKKLLPAPVAQETEPSEGPELLANPLRVNALPSPFSGDSSSSVFYNPFQKAQEDKKEVLEKHVKMTENPKDVREINGKKICWNYRKGRCKFGHKCKYAHDSDVIQQADQTSEVRDPQASSVASSLSGWSYGELANFGFDEPPVVEETDTKRKRRAGLAEGLIPNSKALKMHHSQQVKERPWLLKN